MTEKKFITKPSNWTGFYHIFNEDNRSVCGKIMMICVNKDKCETFTGKEKYSKGQDCKACFRKAGLINEIKN